MNAREKARLLGLFFGIYTALSLVMLVAIGVFYAVIFGFITSLPTRPGDPPPEFMLPFILIIFAFALLISIVFMIPEVVAAYGLRKEKPWARLWTIIASVLAVMSFPFGTAVGVFGLIFTFSDEGKAYFAEIEARNALGSVNDPILQQPPAEWR